MKISQKSVEQFLRNLADKQTDKQVDTYCLFADVTPVDGAVVKNQGPTTLFPWAKPDEPPSQDRIQEATGGSVLGSALQLKEAGFIYCQMLKDIVCYSDNQEDNTFFNSFIAVS